MYNDIVHLVPLISSLFEEEHVLRYPVAQLVERVPHV